MLSTSKAPPWMIGRKGWFEVDNPKLSPSGILRDGGKASSKTGFDFGLRDQLLHWPSWLFMPWLRSGRVSMMLIKFRPFWGKPTMSGITGAVPSILDCWPVQWLWPTAYSTPHSTPAALHKIAPFPPPVRNTNGFSPHLCVGFLFLVLHPVRRLHRLHRLPLPSPPPVTHNLS